MNDNNNDQNSENQIINFKESIWEQSVMIPPRPSLLGDLVVDTAVIGGGLAGILIASLLRDRGIQSVVLEAKRIGSGQTMHTTAKITSQHACIYDKLIRIAGEGRAKQYAISSQKAIALYDTIIKSKQIPCEFQRLPAYLYSRMGTEVLIREADAARKLGINASFTHQTDLPFPVAGAVGFEEQAQFHPLLFLKAIAEGLTIYEETKVNAVKGHSIYTDRGIVTAKHIVFATHFPFVNVPGFYFARLYQERSLVIALRQAGTLPGMYYGIDSTGSYSFRSSGEYLLIGGENYRTGYSEKPGGGMGGGQQGVGGGMSFSRYNQLINAAKELYPGCTIHGGWSAQDCMTLDGIPYIGRFSLSRPYWYVATGFGKWGMTNAMVSAMLISDLIEGQKSSWGDVYSPRRFHFFPTVPNLLKGVGISATGLTKQLFTGTPQTRCPHMGCHLNQNLEEGSWDCPCHGSRFDKEGNLLDNPAQINKKLNYK